MHLDAPRLRIEPRHVLELRQHKIAVQLAINPRQEIQVKRRSNAQRIIVSFDDLRNRLLQIRSQQQAIIRLQNVPNFPKKIYIGGMAEVSDRAAEKQQKDALTLAPSRGNFQ